MIREICSRSEAGSPIDDIQKKSPSKRRAFFVQDCKKGVTKYRNPCMVRWTGIEPAQPCSHQPLKLARLPIPPPPQTSKYKNFQKSVSLLLMYSICLPDDVTSYFRHFVCERHFLPIYTCNVNSKVMFPLFFRGLLRGRGGSDRLYLDRACLFRSCFCRRLAGWHD